MTIAVWILSLLLIAEFVMAPVNLWTGRTMPLFTRFAGYSPRVVPAAGIAGSALISGICAVYLTLLTAPGRRDRSGIIGFAPGHWIWTNRRIAPHMNTDGDLVRPRTRIQTSLLSAWLQASILMRSTNPVWTQEKRYERPDPALPHRDPASHPD